MPNRSGEIIRELYERSIERLVQLVITLNAGAITFSASLISIDLWWLLTLSILLSWGMLLASLINGILFLFERTNALQLNLVVFDRGLNLSEVPDAEHQFKKATSEMAKNFQRCLSMFIGGIILLAVFAAGRIIGGWAFPLFFLVSGIATFMLVHKYLSKRYEGWSIDFSQASK